MGRKFLVEATYYDAAHDMPGFYGVPIEQNANQAFWFVCAGVCLFDSMRKS